MKVSQAISKSILASKYGVSIDTLSNLMNTTYFVALTEVGYEKNMKILPPIIIRKFIELYGEPITDEEL